MKLDKNANEVQLKTYFDASDVLKYHIALCEVFKHKNGKDKEMRQYRHLARLIQIHANRPVVGFVGCVIRQIVIAATRQ